MNVRDQYNPTNPDRFPFTCAAISLISVTAEVLLARLLLCDGWPWRV